MTPSMRNMYSTASALGAGFLMFSLTTRLFGAIGVGILVLVLVDLALWRLFPLVSKNSTFLENLRK